MPFRAAPAEILSPQTAADRVTAPEQRRVLLYGAGFGNQGAFLMLSAAADFVRHQLGAQPVIEIQQGSERQKRWLGLDTLLAVQRLRIHPMGPRSSRARPILNQLPFVFAAQIDCVLDISGFIFSDHWRHVPIDTHAESLSRWKRRNVPAYLLPQAFGPFTETAAIAQKALKASEIIYARDTQSFDYVRSILPPELGHRLRLSGDFTLALKGTPVAELDDYIHAGGVVIVPNWNIADRAPNEESQAAYIQSLAGAVDAARAHGLPVFGLSHEGPKDLRILQAVREHAPGLPIVAGLDGLQSKWLLGRSKLVVSARFHALVSAMSQGIPVAAHGWSHKYAALLTDFNSQDLALDPFAGRQATRSRIAELLGTHETISTRLSKASSRMSAQVDMMWSEVAAAVRERWQTSSEHMRESQLGAGE